MLSNWTKATTTTTGTGTLTLDAVSGFPRPSDMVPIGTYLQYSLHTGDGKFEAGLGKVAASNTLERSKIYSTFDGSTLNETTATALSLASGTHEVFITPMTEGMFEPLGSAVLSGPSSPGAINTALSGGTANVTPTAGYVWASPFRLESTQVVNSMGVKVNTAQAGSSVLLGMYSAGPDGKPDILLGSLASALDSTSTGFKSGAVFAPFRLKPGWYWVASLSLTAAPAFSARTLNCTAMGGTAGYTPLTGILSASGKTDLDAPFNMTSAAYVDASSWPNIPNIYLF